MPSNIRQKWYINKPTLVDPIMGTGGASVGEMLYGSATFNTASTTAGSTYVGTVSITGLNATAQVFVQVATGLAACTVLTSACVSSAGVLSASVRTTGSATSACAAVTLQYFAIGG